MKKSENSSIFIIGSARTGTTLLGRMLSSHSNIYMKNESTKVLNTFRDKKTRNQILEVLGSEIKGYENLTIDEILNDMGKKRWGFKDPASQYYLKHIVDSFPEAQFVFIIRDARAVALSQTKTKFGTANVFYAAEKWSAEVVSQRKFAAQNPEKSCLVRYEDLIVSPEKELSRICAFLGESYETGMQKYYENKKYIDQKNKSNVNTFKKLDPAIIHKWKHELSKRQINVIESIADQSLIENGYELIGEKIKISPIIKQMYIVHQKIMSEIQLQYQIRLKPIMNRWKSL